MLNETYALSDTNTSYQLVDENSQACMLTFYPKFEMHSLDHRGNTDLFSVLRQYSLLSSSSSLSATSDLNREYFVFCRAICGNCGDAL
ncbi:unnamed protein product [Rotaria sp. Silwood1]|nr:unnamed protein product [Rotaria sp. Silwood1]